jgi:hypothetical protein
MRLAANGGQVAVYLRPVNWVIKVKEIRVVQMSLKKPEINRSVFITMENQRVSCCEVETEFLHIT